MQDGSLNPQHDVTVQRLPDGGVIVTVPFQRPQTLASIGAGSPSQAYVSVHELQMARLKVTLNSQWLTIYDSHRIAEDCAERTWPLSQVGVIRPNRYERGVYVTITGRDSFDLIADCPDDVIRFVGQTLEQTLSQLRNPPVTHVVE